MHSLKIFLKLCKLNLKKLLIYRMSFVISLALMFVWVVAYIVLVEVIFYHTATLAGWSKGHVLLILSFYYLIQNLSDIFFKDNFEEFGERVRRGDIDFNIVRPASARLLSFFWEIRFDHAAGLIITGALFYYAFKTITEPVSTSMFLLGLLFAVISLVLYYSILSFIATATFWIEKNETFNGLIFNISQLSRYPRQIYGQLVGKALTYFLPFALIASIPAEVTVQFENYPLTLFFIGITMVFYILSHVFWRIGLKKYTSAG